MCAPCSLLGWTGCSSPASSRSRRRFQSAIWAAAAVDVLVERDVEAVDEVGQVGLRAPPHRVSLESEMAPETNSPDVSGRVRRRQLAASLDAGSVDFGETVQGARLPRLSRAQDSQV